MTSNNGKRQWAFDLSDVKKAKHLWEIQDKVKSREGILEELCKRTVTWPLDGDPKDPDAWGELDISMWIEGQEKLAKALQNFLGGTK